MLEENILNVKLLCFFLIFKINEADQIERPSEPVLARGPYVRHPALNDFYL